MSDKSVPITLKFCSLDDLQRLPRDGPQDLYPRRAKSKEYRTNIYKLAAAVEQAPWSMHRAAQELRLWVDSKHTRPGLLDVSFVFDFLKERSRSGRRGAIDRFFVDSSKGRRAVGLEPTIAHVTVSTQGRGSSSPDPQPSAEAEFVYSVAAELVSHHDFSWANAIALGEQTWARFPRNQRQAVKRIVQEDDAEAAGGSDDKLQMPIRE